MVVLSRVNLSVKDIKYYNTWDYQPPIEKQKIFRNYTNSTFFTTTTTTLNISQTFSASDKLINDIQSLTEDSIIAIVSCYGWEKYFSYDLAKVLSYSGAYHILEFHEFGYTFADPLAFSDQNLTNPSHFYHPFAFVGIPFIGPANGFESIKTNKGNFLSSETLPFAEIVVRLKFNKITRNYQFDQFQYIDKVMLKDDYNQIHNSKDYSLSSLFPMILYSNFSSNYGDVNLIYNYNSNTVNKATKFYQTALDKVLLGNGVSARYDNSGNNYIQGVNPSQLSYYPYYNAVINNRLECPSPFNRVDLMQCLDPKIASQFLNIPFLQCQIGYNPHFCGGNVQQINMFPGFT